MTLKAYTLAFVLASGLLGLGFLPNLALVAAQAQTAKEPEAEAERLVELGNQQFEKSQYREALQSFQSALGTYRSLNNRSGEGDALIGLGEAHSGLGQYQKAQDFYQQALAIRKQLGDRAGEANALHKLGDIYDSLGQYQKSIDFHESALAIFKQLGDRDGEGNALNGLGDVYESLGQYQKAIAYYQESLKLRKQTADRIGEVYVLNGLGDIYDTLGQYQKAIEFHESALAISKEIGDRKGEANSLFGLGIAHSSLGNHQKANDFHQQALSIYRQIGDRNGEAYALNGLGDAYSSLEDYQKAIESFQQAFSASKQVGDPYNEGLSLERLGTAFTDLKQTELAILFYKQSVNVRESIRKDIRKLPKELQKSYLATIEESYRHLIDLLLKQGRVTEAVQVLDLLKIQELEGYLKNVRGNDRTAQGIGLLAPEQAFSGQLTVDSFKQPTELNRQLASQIQQLPKSEINKVPEYLQKLPQGAVLIYPLILSDRLELIIFSANTFPINRTVPIKKADLEKLVTDFRSDLQDFSSIDVKDSSKKLYDVLIEPIEADLKQANATTILYAPDRQLRYIPLAALYDGNQWLVERYRVNNLIAYSLFDPNSKPQANLRIFAGAFGGKSGETRFGLGGLPSTIPEVENIAATLSNTTKLIERDFTASATKAKVAGQTIVHFATHAEFKSGSPNNSYVLFGDGSKVTLAEINEWQLKDADLVVLSACQTGIGSLGNGAEILGFGYQVQRAGAKASIASLWTVSDGGTQVLMEAFYGNLKKGNISMSTALREAQLSMIRKPIKQGEVNFNHPYYWSAFVLIGNGL
ncbi:CHAT domain-containing protein [Tumidithrix elongata RA019]|uniref:CHAT domain-containing protein n=2 Tax=Tumidithrix TaxID=3088355 RepID=A0AAW9Q9A8_9CYAN|nr:CHAT domain-containing protein [Tumidithrix elongata RA019]